MSLIWYDYVISRLLYVSDHSFVAILSTNEVKLVSLVIKNSRIVTKVDTIPLVDLMTGCISQKGHFSVDPTSDRLFYITSSNHVACRRISDNQTEELPQGSSVWKIVRYSPDALLYVNSDRSCLHYLSIQHQVDREMFHFVLILSL